MTSSKHSEQHRDFDVFLSHNSKNKTGARELALALQEYGLTVWLDEWELAPGRPWQEAIEESIEAIKSSVVLVGEDGLGPWEKHEMRAFLSEFVDRGLPVIPVLLPGAGDEPKLPIFLKAFTWVDLRAGLEPHGVERLVWGVTGKKVSEATRPEKMAGDKLIMSSRKKKTELEAAKQNDVDSADGSRVGEEPVSGIRLRCICRGHQGTIGRISWSPCGRFIASPSSDKTIRIWDANDGKCLAVLTGHESPVNCVEWAPNRPVLISGDEKGEVRAWNTKFVDELKAIGFPQDVGPDDKIDLLAGEINCIAWSPNGSRIAWGSEEGSGELAWDNSKHILSASRKRKSAKTCVSWRADSHMLASGGDDGIEVRDANTSIRKSTRATRFKAHDEEVYCVCWTSDGRAIVSTSPDNTVKIWNWPEHQDPIILNAHTGEVKWATISSDRRLLVTKGDDDILRFWNADTFVEVGRICEETSSDNWRSSLAFHPKQSTLATLGTADEVLRIWDLDADTLLGTPRLGRRLIYTSAKIVLVGESNVGKSCLAMRLAEDRYPEDHEHGTTHGMRFWPMEATTLHPSAKPPTGQRRDVVLWDFGGQDEYQLVHQMFLHDTTLALVLIDPTRGRAAMDEARDWNKRLEKHLGKDKAVKLLIGTKVDKKRDLIDRNSIDAICEECGFAAFLDLSAKTGRNTKRLRKLISDALDWDQMAKTSRPELFQHIRDNIEARRKKKEIVLTLDAFKRAIKRSAAKMYEEAAVDAVSDQLATQGIIVRTKLTPSGERDENGDFIPGDEVLVLNLPTIERYAGSLIIVARNNPRRVPVLEERLLGSTKTIPLPGMTKKERLSPKKERMVLECIVELMIQHGICFRYGGLLIFPSMFPLSGDDKEKLPHSVTLYYDFTGAIDNIYASLVSKLMVSEEFGGGRLLPGRVEFDRPREGVCGIRQVRRGSGLAHVDLFFSEQTPKKQRDLFVDFVERHLADNGVDIRERQTIKCTCGEEIDERIIHANIARGEKDVVCPVCRKPTLISEGVAKIREQDPKSEQNLLALRRVIEERTAKDVAIAKSKVSRDTTRSRNEPIRALHLSDLHFTHDTSPQRHLVPLLQDIRNGDFLGFDSLEYLIISGDMTEKGDEAGFDKARDFVGRLIDEMELSVERCILLPGNHDVRDVQEAHQRAESVVDGEKIWVRNPEGYKNRFRSFSDAFYHKIVQLPYPLDYSAQGMSFFFPQTGIQFLALNSAWQIDKFGRDNSGIHPDAVTAALHSADKEVARAVDAGEFKKSCDVLKIAVWHHALKGKWAMQDDEFLEPLQAAGVKLCLHGDVHESRRKLVNWWDKGGVNIIGAGTFGSPEEGRPPSTPRLYNLLEIQPNLKSIRVHTREQRKEAGAWKGWYEWPDPDGGDRQVPYFDIELT